MGKMIKTGKDICSTCKYYKCIAGNFGYCDYLCMTGNRRACKCGECDKYKKKEES